MSNFKDLLKSIGFRFLTVGSNADMEYPNEYQGKYFYESDATNLLIEVGESAWALYSVQVGELYLLDQGNLPLTLKQVVDLLVKHGRNVY